MDGKSTASLLVSRKERGTVLAGSHLLQTPSAVRDPGAPAGTEEPGPWVMHMVKLEACRKLAASLESNAQPRTQAAPVAVLPLHPRPPTAFRGLYPRTAVLPLLALCFSGVNAVVEATGCQA